MILQQEQTTEHSCCRLHSESFKSLTLWGGVQAVWYICLWQQGCLKQHLQYHSTTALVLQLRHVTTTTFSSQVVKAYYLKGDKFVAVKRINVFEKVVFTRSAVQMYSGCADTQH